MTRATVPGPGTDIASKGRAGSLITERFREIPSGRFGGARRDRQRRAAQSDQTRLVPWQVTCARSLKPREG